MSTSGIARSSSLPRVRRRASTGSPGSSTARLPEPLRTRHLPTFFGAKRRPPISRERAASPRRYTAKFPHKLLAYNCSPSFNWAKKLDPATIATFQVELGKMGYKFQFVTLAGFHALNFSMFELARNYAKRGMAAYSELQVAELAAEPGGYTATRHQREVGTGYFDQVAEVISAGQSATLALGESTEAQQF